MKRNFSAIRRGSRSSLLRSQLSVARYILVVAGCSWQALQNLWNVQPSSMKSFLDPNGSPAKVKEPWCKRAMTHKHIFLKGYGDCSPCGVAAHIQGGFSPHRYPRSPAPSWHKPSHQPWRLAITTPTAWNSLSCLVLDHKRLQLQRV